MSAAQKSFNFKLQFLCFVVAVISRHEEENIFAPYSTIIGASSALCSKHFLLYFNLLLRAEMSFGYTLRK